MIDTRLLGATRQNPVSFRLVFKARLPNLVAWIVSGTAPPDPIYIEGTVDSEGKVNFATDADGNVKGGLRLPHMPTVLLNGERAGAPLSVYGGLDPDYLNPRQPDRVVGRDLCTLLGPGTRCAVLQHCGLRALGPQCGGVFAR
jgi:Alpha/beta hydrolase domain